MDWQKIAQQNDLVDLTQDPDFLTDIIYATPHNFTGQQLYPRAFCCLRRETYQKLKNASELLRQQEYRLLIWDAFRPLSIQRHMWQLVPDERFVTNPDQGNSCHCKGNTVDVTLADESGHPLTMPTKFDDFSSNSFRDHLSQCSPEIQERVRILTDAMTQSGFATIPTEWWHFTDTQDYPYIEA